MKKYFDKVFSSWFSMIGLFLLIVAIGVATFIENSYDTNTAKQLIFNSKLFEGLLVILALLYVGIIIKKKLLSREKIPQLILHFAFALMIIGASVTRYFGFDADIHIVENESVNTIYTSEPYLNIKSKYSDVITSSEDPIYFSQIEDNSFQMEIGMEDSSVLIIIFKSYSFDDNGPHKQDQLVLDITYKGKQYVTRLLHDKTKYVQKFETVQLDDTEIELSYGPKALKLPFAIQLNKFVLTKYPGTNLPSASESHITLIDRRNNIEEDHIIAKNQVLDYDGYRFFQTSYDEDEKGTILSLNYDYYGTRITYLSYILLVIGFFLILFSKNTYFGQLNQKIKETREKRKALLLTIVFLVGFNTIGFSQSPITNSIDKEHSEKFGQLVVQNYNGRFSSLHSLALDMVHKITGKHTLYIEGKGKMTAMQIFHDILVDPDFWNSQRLIKVKDKKTQTIIGIEGKYASYNDFYNGQDYKLEELARTSFMKKESERTRFEKEILKLTEKVRLLLMCNTGSYLKIFPLQDSEDNKWLSWNDSLAFKPLYGQLLILNEDLKLDDFTYSNIMRTYLISTIYARESGDYSIPDKLLGYMDGIQRQISPEGIIPTRTNINLEITYNKSRVFEYLKYIFALLGLILLVLCLIKDFGIKSSKNLNTNIKVVSALIIVGFAFQTCGMILRWYLSGHAPWSNGYEVLLFVAWGSILAGLILLKQSKITLAATSILSSIMLMIAGLSYYDPQLTNLTPVLKSYWLIIHVGVITIGYSFLALSFMLALINLIIKVAGPRRKVEITTLVFEELTYTNEKLLTIGLFLTAIGTFLGGVWANESWGRYWGWDAKETWSLVIILTYGLLLHLKFIPKLQSHLTFNIASILSFSTVIMTFVGVNYYFTKGLHSYATDDPPVFPIWAWVIICSIFLLIIAAVLKSRKFSRLN